MNQIRIFATNGTAGKRFPQMHQKVPITFKVYHSHRRIGKFHGFGDAALSSPGRESSAFLRFRKASRSSMTSRPHRLHLIRISAPVRRTVHSSPPQGCGFRVRTTSPGRISSTIKDTSQRDCREQEPDTGTSIIPRGSFRVIRDRTPDVFMDRAEHEQG